MPESVTIFGRPAHRYLASLPRAHRYLREVLVCFRLFKSPSQVLRAYVTRRPPRSRTLELRTGMRIFLSEDPLDIVTVFGLFVRRDYGTIPSGSRVIDIGANIGVFSLYAIHCGASVVHAYEPSSDSFRCLRRNVDENLLADRIKSFHAAVGGGTSRTVRFPRKSSVFNTILPEDAANDELFDYVPLETLSTVIARLPDADMIKLDCEGEEENILAACGAATLAQVAQVRLEYHNFRGEAVREVMQARQFELKHLWAPDPKGGIAWFERTTSQL
jgi:FkbM family methyltransferase